MELKKKILVDHWIGLPKLLTADYINYIVVHLFGQSFSFFDFFNDTVNTIHLRSRLFAK